MNSRLRNRCTDKEKPRLEERGAQVPLGGSVRKEPMHGKAFTRLFEIPAQRISDPEELNGTRDSEYAGAHEIRHAQAIARYRAQEG
jgi:hypothetical protein